MYQDFENEMIQILLICRLKIVIKGKLIYYLYTFLRDSMKKKRNYASSMNIFQDIIMLFDSQCESSSYTLKGICIICIF